MAEIELVRTSDPVGEMARRLRDRFVAIHARQGFVRMAIPGGRALEAFGAFRSELDPALWARTRLTWVDERRVPQEHPDSNRGEAYRRAYLSPASKPALELPLYLEDESPEEARRRVEAHLAEDFRGVLDLLLLGMGEDGHIASLFPGHPWSPAPARVQVVDDSPKPPPGRMSLTLSLLGKAPDAMLLVTGAAKGDALRGLLRNDPDLPGSALSRLTLVTDLQL